MDLPHPDGPITATNSPSPMSSFDPEVPAPARPPTRRSCGRRDLHDVHVTPPFIAWSETRRLPSTSVRDHGRLASLHQRRRQGQRRGRRVRGHGRLRHHRLAGFGQLLESLGQVDGVADEVYRAAPRNRGEPPRPRPSSRRGRARTEVDPLLASGRLTAACRGVHCARAATTRVRVVLLLERGAEHGHHRVAHELHHRAISPEDRAHSWRPRCTFDCPASWLGSACSAMVE